jgi:hypothetical protein
MENFIRTMRRVANDDSDSGTPADQTRTEKDRAQVEVTKPRLGFGNGND